MNVSNSTNSMDLNIEINSTSDASHLLLSQLKVRKNNSSVKSFGSVHKPRQFVVSAITEQFRSIC
jgi:hypothetical protein